ncbi:MAG: ANTAR domain-containing protein [Streptosporangiales bacterium]
MTTEQHHLPDSGSGAEAIVGAESGVGDRLVTALAGVAKELCRPGNQDETLAAIVAAAINTVPGAEQAGVSLVHRDGAITSHHPSSETIATVDQLQSTYAEGPCVTALREEHMVVVDDLAVEASRWPRFAPEAVSHGVASMLSFQLFAAADTRGALNLYSSQPKAFAEESHLVGELFASHAAVALAGARHAGQLEQALSSRDVIGQAKGILMERFGVDADGAFTMLVSSSQNTDIKVVDVARWLATTVGENRPGQHGHDRDAVPTRRAGAEQVEATQRTHGSNGLVRIEPLADDRAGLRLTGEIDLSNREQLTAALAGLTAATSGHQQVHLELAGLDFIDVAGTRVLLATAEQLHEHGGRLILNHPSPVLSRVLALLVSDAGLAASENGSVTLPYH